MHVPTRRTGSGQFAYAPVGQPQAVDGRAALICHACGDALAHISAQHLRRHGLTTATYRATYGLQSLIAPALAATRAQGGSKRYADNAAVRDGLATGQRMARTGALQALADQGQRAEPPRGEARARAAATLKAVRQRASSRAQDRHAATARAHGYLDGRTYLERRYTHDRAPVSVLARELGMGETQVAACSTVTASRVAQAGQAHAGQPDRSSPDRRSGRLPRRPTPYASRLRDRP